MLAGWVTRGRPIRLIINAQARPSTRSEEQFHVTGAIGDVYCIDGNRTVAEQVCTYGASMLTSMNNFQMIGFDMTQIHLKMRFHSSNYL